MVSIPHFGSRLRSRDRFQIFTAPWPCIGLHLADAREAATLFCYAGMETGAPAIDSSCRGTAPTGVSLNNVNY
jgi:hypothetical protein